MTDVVPSRQIVQQEEVRYRSAISEFTAFKLAQLNNHNAKKLYSIHSWHLNGFYALASGSTGPDGIFFLNHDIRIVGIGVYVNQVGSSLTTTIDIHKLTGGGVDAGTIFTTKPEVDTTAASGSYTHVRYDSETNAEDILQLPTGHTKPVFSGFDFLAGEALRFDIDTAMLGSEGFQVSLMYIPIAN